MKLKKDIWTKKDGKEFQNYLLSFSKGQESIKFESKIVNSNLPCVAVPRTAIQSITKEILKGNFLSFLDLWLWDNCANTFIIAGLIPKIKDFKLMKHYLDIFSEKCDSWASTDSLKFKINKKNKLDFLNISKEYVKSNLPFKRRIALIILLKMTNETDMFDDIFKISNSLFDEEHYYVNMANAWVVCECFVKNPEKTKEFLKTHNLNKFTINKMISKCHDSFRISEENKLFLNKYKQK